MAEDKEKKVMVDLTANKSAKPAGIKGPLTATLILGGKNYEVRELPSRKNANWRKLVTEQMSMITDIIEATLGTDIQSPEGLGKVIESMGEQVVGSFDTMRLLIYAYSPAILADQERILDEGYDSEVIPAFMGVLKLAFPFGSVANKILELSTVVNSTTQQ